MTWRTSVGGSVRFDGIIGVWTLPECLGWTCLSDFPDCIRCKYSVVKTHSACYGRRADENREYGQLVNFGRWSIFPDFAQFRLFFLPGALVDEVGELE